MAKTPRTAQGRAPRPRRRGTEALRRRHGAESRAQHDTQVPVSGDIAEIEAVEAGIAAGAPEAASRRPTRRRPAAPQSAPRRRPPKESEKRKKDEQKRRESEQLAKKQKQAQADRQRGGVIGFLASCWAELKKVQWPDRDTLVQATAVTIIFVAVAAAYLGALDALFNFLVKQIL